MPNVELAGFLQDSVGTAVSGATVNTFKRNDTATALSSTTTNASGYWTITETAADAAWLDIRITNGTEITWFRYDDKIQVTKADVQSLVTRNDSATSSFGITLVPATLTQDQTFTFPATQSTAATILTGAQFQNDSDVIFGTSVTAYKSASQNITSSALENDTHLQIAVSSATFYAVTLFLHSALQGDSGDPFIKWSAPANANLQGISHGGTNAAPVTQLHSAASSVQMLATGVNSSQNAMFFGFLETNSAGGTIIPQWRQAGADSTATVISEGSWLRLTRISS